MIRVTFEAARFRVLRLRGVASLAGFDSGKEHISRVKAAQRLFVATDARKTAVGVMVEFCVRHPTGGYVGVGNLR